MDKATITKLVAVTAGGYGLYWANKRWKWKMPAAVAGALGAGVGYTLGNLLADLLTPAAAVQPQQQVALPPPQQGYGRVGGQRYLPPAQAGGGNGVSNRPTTAEELLADLGPLEGSFSDIDNGGED